MSFEVLPKGTTVYTDENHRLSCDALILCLFSKLKKFDRILDIGSGCGIIPLKLYDEGLLGECVALEIDKDAYGLIGRSITKNMLHRFSAINCDAREYQTDRKFDIVFCNPPYFNSGKESENPVRRTARHETSLTLRDVAVISRRSLKEGGKLFICYRPERLADIFSCFADNELRVKRLRFVRKTAGDNPWLVLVEARYRSGPGVTVMPDLIVDSSLFEESDKTNG